MKKILSLVTVLTLILICACGTVCADEQPEKQLTALSAEQLEEYSKEFEMIKDGRMNVLCCFLMSDYEKIEDMDLSAFLHNFPEGEDVKDGEEFEALKALDGWSFGNVSFNEMPLPVHKYTRTAVDTALAKHGDTSSDKLTVGKENVLYSKEYDAFYNFTSDFALDSFRCTSGETDGEITTLYAESYDGRKILKLTKSEDGDIVILSHTTERMAGLANPWTDCEMLSEAEELAGFTLDIGEQLGGYKAEVFRVMPEKMLEVRYTDGDSEVTVRKAPGAGQDISGDYNNYEKIESAEQNGLKITYNHIKDGGVIVLLSDKDKDYSYCVSAYDGFPGDSGRDFVDAICK